jgi:gliding motility-associated-like protein
MPILTYATDIKELPTAPSNLHGMLSVLPTCSNPTATLTITNPLGKNLSYSINSFPYQSSPEFQSLIPNAYLVRVKDDSTGCFSKDSLVVTVSEPVDFPIPKVTKQTQTSCPGASNATASISVTGGQMPYSFSWSPKVSTSDSAVNLAAGSYLVTVTDANACTGYVNVDISEPDSIKVAFTVMDVNCNEASYGSIEAIPSGGTGTYSYNWHTLGKTTSKIDSVPAGAYSVTITDTNGCSITSSDTVKTIGELHIQVEPFTTTISEGMSVQLQATGALYYLWENANSLSCNDCTSPIASPTDTTLYEVKGHNEFGCTGSALAKVMVTPVCGELYVPNTFTPNNDQFNDLLTIGGVDEDCITEYLFVVYDRWGTNVFESKSVDIHWDGSYQGMKLNTGAYYYYVRAVYWNQKVIEQSGNCNIVR